MITLKKAKAAPGIVKCFYLAVSLTDIVDSSSIVVDSVKSSYFSFIIILLIYNVIKTQRLVLFLLITFRKFNYPPPNIEAIALNIRKSFINPASPLRRKHSILKNEAIVDQQIMSSRYDKQHQLQYQYSSNMNYATDDNYGI